MRTREEVLRALHEEIAASPEENPEAAEIARERLQEDDETDEIVAEVERRTGRRAWNE